MNGEIREKSGKIVESALADYGGDITKKAVLWHLKHTYNLEPADAVLQPKSFVQALNDIYGEDFAKIIEEDICEKLSQEFEVNGNGLVELAEKIREKEGI